MFLAFCATVLRSLCHPWFMGYALFMRIALSFVKESPLFWTKTQWLLWSGPYDELTLRLSVIFHSLVSPHRYSFSRESLMFTVPLYKYWENALIKAAKFHNATILSVHSFFLKNTFAYICLHLRQMRTLDFCRILLFAFLFFLMFCGKVWRKTRIFSNTFF